MANPQLENGFTRIANEILTNVYKTKLNGTQLRIVLCIWRWAYGFQDTTKEMGAGFIAKEINTARRVVKKELDILLNRKIIVWAGSGKRGVKILGFNKNYEEWEEYDPAKEDHIPEEEKPKKDQEDQPKEEEAEEEPQKKKKQTKKKKYDEESTPYKMADYFFKLVSKVAEEAGVQHLLKKVNLQTWADDFRKLMDIDGVDKRQAFEVMQWVTQDDFWKVNILSASKFRKQYLNLVIKMNASNKRIQQLQQPQPRVKDAREEAIEREIAFNRWVNDGNDPEAFKWKGDKK
jgi:phage replication O-like protein O